MRHFTIAIAACFLAACATARTTQVTAQAPEGPVAACDAAGGPLIIVDGVVQEPACGERPDSAAQCEAGSPLYVVDGVRSCAKP